MTNERKSAQEDWHLDKRVPVSLIFALVLQTAGFAYWGATFKANTEQRLLNAEQQLGLIQDRNRRLVDRVRDQETTLAVLINRLDNTNENVEALTDQIRETNRILREGNNDP